MLKELLIKTLFYLTSTDWYNDYWEHCLNEIKKSEAFDENGKVVSWIFERHPFVEFLISYFENYFLLGNLIGADRLALNEVKNFVTILKNPQLLSSKDNFDMEIKPLNALMSRIGSLIKEKNK